MAAARARPRSEYDTPRPAKPRSDVYVGLLLLALIAQIVGGVFLYMDYSQYPDKPPSPLPGISAPQQSGQGLGPGKAPGKAP